jgi:phage-related protein
MDAILMALLVVAVVLVGGYFLIGKVGEEVKDMTTNAGRTANKVINDAANAPTKSLESMFKLVKVASDDYQKEVKEWISIPTDGMMYAYGNMNKTGWDIRNGVTSGIESIVDTVGTTVSNTEKNFYNFTQDTTKQASTAVNWVDGVLNYGQNQSNNVATQVNKAVGSLDNLWGFDLNPFNNK